MSFFSCMVYRTTQKMADRKQARRDRILDKAIRLFGKKGFHATTVPMIVRAAGSSTGAFYLYFRNKEDVFGAAMELLGARIASAINEAAAAAPPGVLSHMQAAVGALIRFLAENPEEARILIVESSGLGKNLETIRRRILDSHVRGVQQALDALAGQLPPMDTAVAAQCWTGAVYEAAFHWLEQPPDRRVTPERLIAEVTAFNLRAIGAAEKRR